MRNGGFFTTFLANPEKETSLNYYPSDSLIVSGPRTYDATLMFLDCVPAMTEAGPGVWGRLKSLLTLYSRPPPSLGGPGAPQTPGA